jgi:hypothetical protein
MKCQSKINVSIARVSGGVDNILIKDNRYECELTPTIYDLVPFDGDSYYIVTCEDGKFRKYKAEKFLTLAEVRETKLNELDVMKRIYLLVDEHSKLKIELDNTDELTEEEMEELIDNGWDYVKRVGRKNEIEKAFDIIGLKYVS